MTIAPRILPPEDINLGELPTRKIQKICMEAYTERAVIVGLAQGGAMNRTDAETVAMAWDNWIDACEYELTVRRHERR